MPSKGDSRATNRGTTATIAPVAGPAVTTVQASLQSLLDESAAIPAVVANSTAPLAANASVPVETAPRTSPAVPDIEDPDVDIPEWADLYARAVERTRNDRERVDREQAEAQQLWEQFLQAQGSEAPEGERSLTNN